MKTLRPYQAEAHTQIYQAWAQKKRPLLCMPTGSGKSFTVLSLVKKCCQVYDFNLVVKTRNLVGQLIKDAREMELPFGVHMAGHPLYHPERPIQICSIDTLRARELFPKKDKEKIINVIDEADQCLSKGFQNFINGYPHGLILGMTATPYNGLHNFDTLIAPITSEQLRLDRVLVDYKYYIPSGAIDTSDISISDGDFNKDQVEKKVSTKIAIGSCVKAWAQYGDHRITLMFANSVMHSRQLVKEFNAYHNKVIAHHCDADTPERVRSILLSHFKSGSFSILSVVGLFIRGTDIPEIGCIIDAAPTLNMNRHVQKMGRGSRQNPFYKDCIYIDMAQNCVNLGPFYMDRSHMINFEKPYKLNRTGLIEMMRRCEKCFGAFEPKDFVQGKCPSCGHLNQKIKSIKKDKNVTMTAVESERLEQEMMIRDFRKEWWKATNLDHYRNKFRGDKRKIRFHCQTYMINKYGIDKVKKIARAIGLDIWRMR